MDFKIQPYKANFNYSYTHGVFPTLELLKYKPEIVLKILIHSKGNTNNGILKIMDICKNKKIPFEYSDKLVSSLAHGNSYALGIFKKFTSKLTEDNHVLLINPDDMGNIGTIIRTLLGLSINNLGIVYPSADLFNPRCVRASMGALFNMNFEYFKGISDYKDKYKHNLYAFSSDADSLLNNVRFKEPFTLIFGNEGEGLQPELKTIANTVRIPQSNLIDSYSLPMALSMATYVACNR